MATTITGTTIDVGPNKLVANSAGDVGVGTASPSARFEVKDNGSATGNVIMKVTQDDQSSHYGMSIGNDTYSTTDTDGFLIYQENNGHTYIYNGGAGVGPNIGMPVAGGITFGSDTAAANALDDYEEGTFNLTMAGGNGNPSSTQTLGSEYVKIGKLVYFRSFGTLNNSGASGPISFSGLPFTPTGVTIASIECNSQGTFSLSPYGYVSGTVIYINQMRSNNSYIAVNHNVASSGEWSITGHFATNS